MLDFNWPQLLIIGTVALVVIGPEDLPQMFRQLGRFTSKLRQMSREFSRAMEQAAKDTGMKDVVKDLKASTSSSALGLDAVKNVADKFEKWDPLKNAAKPTSPMPARTLVPPPMPATPAPIVATTPSAAKVIDDAAEAADDLAEHAPKSANGPATQALFDKQALRAQVIKEQTEKLIAIEAGTYVPAPLPEVVKPAPKKRAVKAAPAAASDTAVAQDVAVAKARKAPGKPKGEKTA